MIPDCGSGNSDEPELPVRSKLQSRNAIVHPQLWRISVRCRRILKPNGIGSLRPRPCLSPRGARQTALPL